MYRLISFILFTLFISSCTKVEYVDRLIYKDKIIYPDLPKLEIIKNYKIKELELSLYEIDNTTLYCLNDNDTIELIKNIDKYKEIIQYYENIISDYDLFYNEYQLKRNNVTE